MSMAGNHKGLQDGDEGVWSACQSGPAHGEMFHVCSRQWPRVFSALHTSPLSTDCPTHSHSYLNATWKAWQMHMLCAACDRD